MKAPADSPWTGRALPAVDGAQFSVQLLRRREVPRLKKPCDGAADSECGLRSSAHEGLPEEDGVDEGLDGTTRVRHRLKKALKAEVEALRQLQDSREVHAELGKLLVGEYHREQPTPPAKSRRATSAYALPG